MHYRKKMILDLLQTGRITLKETARILDVSEMTLRRDFRELEEEKMLLQVKGGAIPYPVQYAPDETLRQLNELKFRLARALIRQISPCRTLFIGTGTTCLAFARTLAVFKNFPMTVVTHSLSVASALFQSRHKVILLGGELRSASMDLVGAVAEKNLTEYQVDWLITGCDGAFSASGFYTSDVSVSNLEKTTISIAQKVAIITESSKFGRRSLVRYAAPEEVDLLITDDGIPEETAAELRSKEIEIVTVPRHTSFAD